jgi:isopentenyl diphosphate isomerase/L-lactate dehydrogenase-like FMN-dependent dehydrogenase
MLREELDTAMAQIGCARIADLTHDRLWKDFQPTNRNGRLA